MFFPKKCTQLNGMTQDQIRNILPIQHRRDCNESVHIQQRRHSEVLSIGLGQSKVIQECNMDENKKMKAEMKKKIH